MIIINNKVFAMLSSHRFFRSPSIVISLAIGFYFVRILPDSHIFLPARIGALSIDVSIDALTRFLSLVLNWCSELAIGNKIILIIAKKLML